MPTITTDSQPLSELMEKLLKEKKIAREFQERRHLDWDDNYFLYRNKVKTNRLTQRQAVNIPLMKETLKTLISKIDDPPNVDWKELGGDEIKQKIFQEMWNHDYDRLNFEAIDIQDKKTVLLYGRSFKKLNWGDDGFELTPLDIYDVVYDPLADPIDIETARFIIHQNIFRSLRDILADDRYKTEAKDRLKEYLITKDTVVQSNSNRQEYERKIERLKAMGVQQRSFALFSGGDVVVNLTEHYTQLWDNTLQKFVRHVVVYADDTVELLNETIDDLLGVDFYPFVTWTEDIETNDSWSDGIADLVRTPNKILNIWFSQLVENRTLRNFQMYWYDATIERFAPQTYEPGPGRMLPAPGDPNKTVMPVNISGLDETLTAIDFLTKVIERGTGATATEKGVGESKRTTLGEVELLVGKAMERTIAMTKFYRRSWLELAMKWYKLLEANHIKKMTLYKTGKNGVIWPKVVYTGDWQSKAGYQAYVRSSSEQEQEQTKGIQKFMFILQQFPFNAELRRIAQRRMLEILDLTSQEMSAVEIAQKQADEQQRLMMQQQQQTQDLTGSIKRRLGALQTLQPPTTVTPPLANAIAPLPVVPNINGI